MDSRIIKDKAFYKELAVLSLPLVIQQLLLVGVNALNSMMMGSFGETEMTAVSQASQIFYIFSILNYGFVMPVGVLCAQYWGKQDGDSVRRLLGIGSRVASVMGIVCAVVTLVFPSQLMRIMTNDPAVLGIGVQYLRITAFTMLPFSISNMLYVFVRSIGRVRLVFWGNFLCYTINIAFNYLLIFGRLGFPSLGPMGPAVGSLISRLCEIALLLYALFRETAQPRVKPRDMLSYDKPLAKDYFKVMGPMLAHETIWSVGVSASQIIMGQISTEATAAYNIAYVFSQLMIAFLSGFARSAQIVVGRSMGAGLIEQTKKQARSIMLVATCIGAVGMLVMLLFRDPFISIYDISQETVAYAHQLIVIMAVVVFFSSWEVVGLVGLLWSAGDARTGFLTDVLVMWMLAIPLGLLAAFKWNLSPVLVILLIKVDMPLKAMVGLVKVLRMKWVANLTRKTDVAEPQSTK